MRKDSLIPSLLHPTDLNKPGTALALGAVTQNTPSTKEIK